jgi:phosphoglycerate dehydrogenase-like enzyme
MITRVLVTYPDHPLDTWLDLIRAVDEEHLDLRVCAYEESDRVRSAKRARSAFEPPPVPDALVDELADAQVLFCLDLPLGMSALAPHLQWVQTASAGIDQLPPVGLDAGVIVTCARGTRAPHIAEFVIARICGVWKRTAELDHIQRAHRWERTAGRTIAGSTMAVVGLGAIGTAVAERAQALGMQVVGVRRAPEPSRFCVDVVTPDRLFEVLGRADAVVCTAPGTPETFDLFDVAAFSAMKRGATFCNVARGSLVDEVALIDALESGQLGAAILDVARTEPLPAEDPLWDAPNLYLSPHSSSGDAGQQPVFELFADNLGRWLRGEALRNVVDLSAGY